MTNKNPTPKPEPKPCADEGKHIMSGSEFAVTPNYKDTIYRRTIESGCGKYQITLNLLKGLVVGADPLEAARHVVTVLNSHDDLLAACEGLVDWAETVDWTNLSKLAPIIINTQAAIKKATNKP